MADFGFSFGPNSFGEPSISSSPLVVVAQSSAPFFPFPDPLEPTPTPSTRSRTRTRTRTHTRSRQQHTSETLSTAPAVVSAEGYGNSQNTFSKSPAQTTQAANEVAAGNAAADQASQSSAKSTSDGGGVSGGVIAAAVVVPVLVLAALGALIFFLLRRRRRQRAAQDMNIPRSPGGTPMETQQVDGNAPRLPPLAISRKPVPYNGNFEPNYGYAEGQPVNATQRSMQPELHMGDDANLSKPPQIAMVNGHYVSSNVSERDPFDDPETPASRLTEPFATGSQAAIVRATPSQQTSAAALRPSSPLDRATGTKDDDEVSEVSDMSDNEDGGPEETAVVSTAQRASVIKLNGTHSAHSSRGSNASHNSNEGSPTNPQQPGSFR